MTVAVRVADVAGLRWPERALVGAGEVRPVVIPVSYSRLSRAVLTVPLGDEGRARADRVRHLRRVVPRMGLPPAMLILGAAWWSLFAGREGWWAFLNSAAVVFVFGYCLIAPLVAVTSRAPRVAGSWLLLPDAHPDVADELVELNPGRAHIR
ncbi:hypothetical protein GCM10010436_48760 [Paractinoplanes durhamensis]